MLFSFRGLRIDSECDTCCRPLIAVRESTPTYLLPFLPSLAKGKNSSNETSRMLLAGSHLAKRQGDQVSWEVDYDYLGIYPLGTNCKKGDNNKKFLRLLFSSWVGRKSQKSLFFPCLPLSRSRRRGDAVRRGAKERHISSQIWVLPFANTRGSLALLHSVYHLARQA